MTIPDNPDWVTDEEIYWININEDNPGDAVYVMLCISYGIQLDYPDEIDIIKSNVETTVKAMTKGLTSESKYILGYPEVPKTRDSHNTPPEGGEKTGIYLYNRDPGLRLHGGRAGWLQPVLPNVGNHYEYIRDLHVMRLSGTTSGGNQSYGAFARSGYYREYLEGMRGCICGVDLGALCNDRTQTRVRELAADDPDVNSPAWWARNDHLVHEYAHVIQNTIAAWNFIPYRQDDIAWPSRTRLETLDASGNKTYNFYNHTDHKVNETRTDISSSWYDSLDDNGYSTMAPEHEQIWHDIHRWWLIYKNEYISDTPVELHPLSNGERYIEDIQTKYTDLYGWPDPPIGGGERATCIPYPGYWEPYTCKNYKEFFAEISLVWFGAITPYSGPKNECSRMASKHSSRIFGLSTLEDIWNFKYEGEPVIYNILSAIYGEPSDLCASSNSECNWCNPDFCPCNVGYGGGCQDLTRLPEVRYSPRTFDNYPGFLTAVTSTPCIGEWSDWSDCSQACDGSKTRTFTITTPAQNDGAPCVYADQHQETEECEDGCDRDTDCVGSWIDKSCPNMHPSGLCIDYINNINMKTQVYTITTPATHNGNQCSDTNCSDPTICQDEEEREVPCTDTDNCEKIVIEDDVPVTAAEMEDDKNTGISWWWILLIVFVFVVAFAWWIYLKGDKAVPVGSNP